MRRPDQLEIKHVDDGSQLFFGTFFVIYGVFFTISLLFKFNDTPTFHTRLLLFFIAIFMTLVGAIVVSFRKGVVLDNHERTIEFWWGLIKPIRSRILYLDNFDFLSVGQEWEDDEYGGENVYPIHVANKNKRIQLDELRTFSEAQQRSHDIANFLGLPIHDETIDSLEAEMEQVQQYLGKPETGNNESQPQPNPPGSPTSKVSTGQTVSCPYCSVQLTVSIELNPLVTCGGCGKLIRLKTA